MRRVFIDATGEAVYAGTAEEIRALYGSMKRAMKAQHTNFIPLYADMPKFNRHERYELQIDEHGVYTVYRSQVHEAMSKRELSRFICQDAVRRCRMLREDGYDYICSLSERSVSINNTIDIPVKEFLSALRNAYPVGINKELCLHVGNLRLWLKPTDDIFVV